MRKLHLIVTLLFSIVALPGMFAQKGEKTMGVLGGYNTLNESASAGVFFQYSFNNHFRLAPDLQFNFRNNNLSSYSFNGNAHYIFKLDTRFNCYPLAGITYQSWRNSAGEESVTKNYFGANFGGGLEYKATSTLKILVEGKYSWIKHFDSGSIYLGLGYVF